VELINAAKKNDNQELQNPKPPLTCSHKACEELAARRAFNSWRKKPNKKRAKPLKQKLQSSKNSTINTRGRKKERTRYTTKTTTIRAAAVCRALKTQQPKKHKNNRP
jgi:hypothetical protein